LGPYVVSLNVAVQSAAMGLASVVGGALVGQTDTGRLAGYPVDRLIAVAAW
jgi:hypothetical protein